MLYVVLHTQIEAGRTAALDEPSNDVSLDEVEPLLMEALSRVQDAAGSQLFLVSHHPETMDKLAPSDGLRLVLAG